MTLNAESRFNYDELVQEERVNGLIYTDPNIFEEEIDKIYHKGWVYVGHSSEIPEPGDYRLTWIGRQSVIMVRDASGQVQLLANRCAHRANSVCQTETGNANYFRCAYHGWTYKANGDLVGVPYSDGYGGTLDKEHLGLAKVPRVADYRGLIFGSLSPTGMSFEEHLPETARQQIDIFFDASPMGEIEVRAGVGKAFYYGNWKFVGMDGYHPNFTHQSSIKESVDRQTQLSGSDKGTNPVSRFQRDLGMGHVRLGGGMMNFTATDQIASNGDSRGIDPTPRKELAPWANEYRTSMFEAYGLERGEFLMHNRGDPHVGIFPNLQIIGVHLRVIRPIRADLTEVFMYPALLKGVPKELNVLRLRREEFSKGAAGHVTPDDYEMFERNQVGLSNQINPWLVVSRGMHREQQLEDGTTVAEKSDELTQRAMGARWKMEMSR